MYPSGPQRQHHATLSVLGMLVIPIVSVSSAALLASPVESAGPVGVTQAIVATLAGSLIGLSILRLLHAATDFVSAAAAAAVGWITSDSVVSILGNSAIMPVAAPVAVATATHNRAISRRGPPHRL